LFLPLPLPLLSCSPDCRQSQYSALENTGKTALPTKSSAGVWRLSFLRRSTKNSNRTSPICQPVGSKR
jgi:hypothetical protein